ADRTLSVAYGTTAGTAAAGNDSRIVNAVQHGDLMYNVKDYGAAGDGTTNDTAALQAALNAAAATVNGVSGGVVFIPRGAYIVTSPLTVASRVSVVGAGATTATIRTTTNNIDILQVIGTSGTHKSQVYFRDFGLIGPGQSSGSTGCGLV